MFCELLNSIAENKDLRANLIRIKELLQGDGNIDKIKSEKRYGISLFPDLLENEDAKVRKNAVLIMGLLGEEGYAEIIAKRYMSEKTLFVRSAYLTALGHYDYGEYREMLKARKDELLAGGFDEKDLKHTAEEIKELNRLLGADKAQVNHKFTDPQKPVHIILTTGADTKEALTAALEKEGFDGIKPVFCGVALKTDKVYRAAHIRIYNELFFPLNGMKSYEKQEIPAAIASGNLMELLFMMHKDKRGAFRFRLDAKDVDAGNLASRIQAVMGGRLVNTVSNYEIEIKLMSAKDGKYGIFLKIHTFGFDRFKYRENFVAASINPVKAAMAVWLAREYMTENANVLDPFCGVGTMLIERNHLVKAGHIYGIDTFGQAIEGARKNTEKAGIHINYINRDYFDFEHELLFDEIITDMPVLSGEEADKLYGRFLKCSENHIRDKGIIIMYSAEKNLIKKHLRLNGHYRLLREFVMDSRKGMGVYVLAKQA